MISRQLFRFLMVGGIGFVVDGGLLAIQLWMGVNPYLARFISFPAAVVATWWFNRIWTFSEANRAYPKRQFKKYLGVQIVGALVNYVTYANVVAAYDESAVSAGVGFVLGSALGMVVNFLGARMLVFRP